MKKGLNLLEKITALASVFLLPSQLAFHFWPSYAFVFGIRVDYLAPAVYLSDLLIAGLLVLVFINDKANFLGFLKRNKNVLLILLTLSVINVLFSTSFPISVIRWLKIYEVLFFGTYFYLRRSFVGVDTITKALFTSAVLFSLIGIFQVILSHTTGLFYILGERSFRLSSPGIALALVGGAEYLRAYSTFPHPNVLAGYLGLTLVVLAAKRMILSRYVFNVCILTISAAMFLTFSSSAFLGIGTVFVLSIFRKKKYFSRLLIAFLTTIIVFSLSLPVLAEKVVGNTVSSSTSQRLDLAGLSGRMIKDNFFIGSGLNTFTPNSTSYGAFLKHPWLLQPVHNIYLLVFTEVGIAGLLFFSWCLYKIISVASKKNNYLLLGVLFFILTTGAIDHYWLTLQQGVLAASFFLGTFLNKS